MADEDQIGQTSGRQADSPGTEANNRRWDRRLFLKAAVLGTAAAAFYNPQDGSFGAFEVSANDLSEFPCTAQDVTVDRTATVLDVPCTCSGPGATFDGKVAFTLHNHTGTDRYCITLHIPDGFGIPAQDVVLGDIGPDQTKTVTGTVKGLPCNLTQDLCIGAPDSDGRGKCDPGTCLTVAWNTSPNADCPDERPPGGQCRHQQICIRGFGATLKCTTNCTPDCGGTAVLEACVNAPSERGPFTFKLTGDDGSSQTITGIAGDADGLTCRTFNVKVIGTVKYTLTVTDKDGCTRTATTTVTAKEFAKPTIKAGTVDCAGKVTLTASPSLAGATYTWFDGATQIGTGNPLTVTLSPGSHSITVKIEKDGCSATSDPLVIKVAELLKVSIKAVGPDCDGKATLTANVTGGTAPYTYLWSPGGETTSSISVQAPGTFSVTVTDASGCTAKAEVKLAFAKLSVSIAITAGPDCDGKTTVKATVTGGTAPFTYAWSNGATTDSITLTAPFTDLSVTVKDANGCTATSNKLSQSFTKLSVTAKVTAGPDCGTGKSTFEATATGGTAPYSFEWFDGATKIGTGNPLSVPSLSVGPHTIKVTVTDAKGCKASATVEITVLGCPGVCTRTLGYWKTHSKYGPAERDAGWNKVGPLGEDTLFFDTGLTWYQVLQVQPGGNAFYILAHQYIAATLNVLNGADPTVISATLVLAKSLLDQYDTNQGAITGALRNQFTSLATKLDAYNNGYIGPGHCG